MAAAVGSVAGPQRYTMTAFNRVEELSLDWMAELFGLGEHMKGVYSSGGSTANLIALGAARQWAFTRRGVDPAAGALTDLRLRSTPRRRPTPRSTDRQACSISAGAAFGWFRSMIDNGCGSTHSPRWATIIEDNDFARRVADRARREPALEVLAEATLSICCFRHRAPAGSDPDEFNQRLLRRLLRETDFMPSSTIVDGRFAIRPCFINVRTTTSHVDAFMDAILRIGAELTDHLASGASSAQ